MFELSSLGTFVAVVLGLFLIPGDFVHTLCAAVGLSALLMTSALAFNVVKIVGAGYLVYLGVRALLEKPADPSLPKLSSVSPAKAFFQAIPAEVLNPKTALFFLAFLPQFVHPERGSSFLQFTTLGLIFVALSALYTTLIVVSIRPLGRIVKRLSWLSRWQSKIIGTIFISLGLKVATQHR
jgi:threonine/homoserine/homoserine lactone efflux protein